ncbi:hypothetical protein [Streptomyces sp. ISL-100]|uniref:hypothetical protein n=1 Tax=Streptomyces sp. ISL-100 TaxID=2819173 RepID=UPI001BE6899F|nr:hypothetical protein [Streptomyces sp. ISL-100]MBT2395943.1 hypothetical protein [Streptomyces sp. ISL-100]
MSSNNEYSAPGRDVTPDDMARFLIPDTPASLITPSPAPETAPERPEIPSTADLIAAWERASAAGVVVQSAPVPAPDTAPIVPRWVWRTSAVTAAVSAMVGLIAFVVWGVAQALGAAAAALEGSLPYLVGAAVFILAAVIATRGKSERGSLSLTVSQTQHITMTKK